MSLKLFLRAFFTFIALVNPLQKIIVVISLQESYKKYELIKIINKSNITALIVLNIFLFAGDFILTHIFNLHLYAFQCTCGIILLYNGFIGLQKGTFITIGKTTRIEEIISVPIAVPMIAGPATITAAVSMPNIYGNFITIIAITTAILINFIIMRNSRLIAKPLIKYNILMPLVRITGLIVAAIGSQMIFNGITTYIN